MWYIIKLVKSTEARNRKCYLTKFERSSCTCNYFIGRTIRGCGGISH